GCADDVAEAVVGLVVPAPGDRKGEFLLLGVLGELSLVLVDAHRDELEAAALVGVVEALPTGHLSRAHRARGGPEVHHHHSAFALGKVDGLAGERDGLELRLIADVHRIRSADQANACDDRQQQTYGSGEVHGTSIWLRQRSMRAGADARGVLAGP